MSGERYFCEIVGPGVALFDLDGDGDLDAFIPQGHMLDPRKGDGARASRGRLFRNDTEIGDDGHRTMRFTDVTAASRIDAGGYGMGVAAGDIDNDGDVDLYLTSFGHNQMWRNEGDGTFADVTSATGTDDARWSTSAAFFDYDRDGWLDLYVVNYVNFRIENHRPCTGPGGRSEYCGPDSYAGETHRLFHNLGTGTFEDASGKAGILAQPGPGLGIVCADLDGDGWIDVYVTNDGKPNIFWTNQRDGTFKNRALIAGTAVSASGAPEASMGIDVGDVDADGDEDIFITDLVNETNVLYRNDGAGLFEDDRQATGLAGPSAQHTGFGAVMFDFDNDGWLDILTVNGAVKTIAAEAAAGDPFPLHETKQLFHNRGNARFEEVSADAGAVFSLSEVGRGAAFGDVDNDGDIDVLLANNNGRARLLVNQLEKRGLQNHWVGISLKGGKPPRDQPGTFVTIVRGSRPLLVRRSRPAASYCSSNDPRVVFGLGQDPVIERAEIAWPDGRNESFAIPAVDRYVTLLEGQGAPLR
ncbi:MAG: CRTAC1 family protein [Acidobacteriota bacterium]